MRTRHWCALCSNVSAVTPIVQGPARRRTTGCGRLLAASPLPGLCRSLYLELFPRKKKICLMVLGSMFIPLPLSTPKIHTVREQKQTPQGWALPLLPPVQQPGKQCGKRIPSRSSSHKGTHKVRAGRPGDSFL